MLDFTSEWRYNEIDNSASFIYKKQKWGGEAV